MNKQEKNIDWVLVNDLLSQGARLEDIPMLLGITNIFFRKSCVIDWGITLQQYEGIYKILSLIQDTKTANNKSQEGYVYLINHTGTNYFKIGISINHPNKRLHSLQTGSPVELKLVKYIRIPAYNLLEKTLHNHYKQKKIRGEWFCFGEDELREINAIFC